MQQAAGTGTIIPITRGGSRRRTSFGGPGGLAGPRGLYGVLVAGILEDLRLRPEDCDAEDLARKAAAYEVVADDTGPLITYVAALGLTREREMDLWAVLFDAQAACDVWYQLYPKGRPLVPAPVAAPLLAMEA